VARRGRLPPPGGPWATRQPRSGGPATSADSAPARSASGWGSHDKVIHAGIAVAAAAVLLVVRPLTATVIIWTTLVALLLLLAVLLVARPLHPAHPA
jgi:hypothetical protein